MVCLIVGELVFHARASNPTRGPFAARHPPLARLLSGLTPALLSKWSREKWPKEIRMKNTISQYVSSSCRLILTCQRQTLQQQTKPHCIQAFQNSFSQEMLQKCVQNCDSSWFFEPCGFLFLYTEHYEVWHVVITGAVSVSLCFSVNVRQPQRCWQMYQKWLKEKWRPVFTLMTPRSSGVFPHLYVFTLLSSFLVLDETWCNITLAALSTVPSLITRPLPVLS